MRKGSTFSSIAFPYGADFLLVARILHVPARAVHELLVYPHPSTKYLDTLQINIDFENRRAIVVDGRDSQSALITVQDLAKVVAAAVDYEGELPETGGIRGQIAIFKPLQNGEELQSTATL